MENTLLGIGVFSWGLLGACIVDEIKTYRKISNKHKAAELYRSPLTPSQLFNRIGQLQFLSKNKILSSKKFPTESQWNELQYEKYSQSEVIFKNMFLIGFTNSYQAMQPQNKKKAFTNLIYSHKCIKNEGNIIDKVISSEETFVPDLSIKDADHDIPINFCQQLNVSNDEINFQDVRKICKYLRPWDFMKLEFSYHEVGITLGGILSVFGDVVYDINDKSVRVENASYLGYTSQFLRSNLNEQKIAQEIGLILMGVTMIVSGYCFGKDLWKIFKKWRKNQERKHKRLNNVFFCKYDSPDQIECKICKSNYKNVFYLPCLHMEICEKCIPAQNSKQLQCSVCSSKVNEPVIVYLS